jgi:hypothetical protein
VTEHEIDLWKEVFTHTFAGDHPSPPISEEDRIERAALFADMAVVELRKRITPARNPSPPLEDIGGVQKKGL